MSAAATKARSGAIMMAQLKKAISEPNEYIKFALKSDGELSSWYILLSGFDGDEGEFKDGEYLVRMEAPEDFPFNPPHFYLMTENGVYGVETKVCINIGEYHKDQYRAALGMAGFAAELMSGLIGWKSLGGGISIIQTTVAEKKKLARASRENNQRGHKSIMNKINDAYFAYSKKWDLSKIPQPMKIKLGLATVDKATDEKTDDAPSSPAPQPSQPSQ